MTAGVSSAGRFSERYQPATGQWPAATGGLGACSSVRECRCGSSATLLGTGEVLVAGGMTGLYSSPGSTTSAMLYDPATSAWTVTGPMSGDRENQTANLLPNGQMLVAGGVSFRNHVATPLASAELYTPLAAGPVRSAQTAGQVGRRPL